MSLTKIRSALFRSHRDASWAVYVPVAAISVLFGLGSIEDAGFVGAIPYSVLLAICLLQMKYRTLLGWAVLLVACLTYAVAVLLTPENGTLGEYLVFALLGLIPAAILASGHPLRQQQTTAK